MKNGQPLSAAKDLAPHGSRSSDYGAADHRQILRFPQDDRGGAQNDTKGHNDNPGGEVDR